MEQVREFVEWMASNKKYSYDSNKFWFNTKTLLKVSWEEVWEKFAIDTNLIEIGDTVEFEDGCSRVVESIDKGKIKDKDLFSLNNGGWCYREDCTLKSKKKSIKS